MWLFDKLIGGGIEDAAKGVETIGNTAGNLVNRLRTAWTGEPDPDKKLELKKLLTEAEALARQTANTINILNAKSSNIFIAGWRPAIGWVCALALFTYYIPRFIVVTYVWATQCMELLEIAKADPKTLATFVLPVAPEMAIGDIIGLVLSLLGMAGMRSYEKKHGVNKKH